MIEPNAMLNPDEHTQFVQAFEDNLDLLLDIVEAVRSESAHVEDETATEFMTGMSQIIRAFRSSHRMGGPNAIGNTDHVWSSEGSQPRPVGSCRFFPSASRFDIA